MFSSSWFVSQADPGLSKWGPPTAVKAKVGTGSLVVQPRLLGDDSPGFKSALWLCLRKTPALSPAMQTDWRTKEQNPSWDTIAGSELWHLPTLSVWLWRHRGAFTALTLGGMSRASGNSSCLGSRRPNPSSERGACGLWHSLNFYPKVHIYKTRCQKIRSWAKQEPLSKLFLNHSKL